MRGRLRRSEIPSGGGDRQASAATIAVTGVSLSFFQGITALSHDVQPVDIAARESALKLQQANITADPDTLRLLLTEARSHHAWQDKPVDETLLRELYDIAKMGPTSMNQQSMRVVFVRSPEARERLKPCLKPTNIAKMMGAPVTAILAYDMKFYEKLPKVFAHNPDAKKIFEGDEVATRANGFRNSTLQGAYFMIAARALGLDVGAMSGFDNAAVDEAFFADTSLRSNFILNIGYADTSKLMHRLPRLDFDEVCQFL